MASEEVIGRDKLIALIWRTLAVQSVVLTSERRIGKTSVVRKMVGDIDSSQTFALLRDIEGLRTPEEFVEAIYGDVEKQLGKVDRAKMGLWRLMEKLGGTQIIDVKLPAIRVHWKALLTALFDDLFSVETRMVIFFWDELPLFIFNVTRAAGEDTAMELLDVLRALRQRHSRLRMVFTGSVGIHQVVNNLRKSGYANDPTNDMAIIEVPPLDPPDGTCLAEELFKGEKLRIDDSTANLGDVAASAVGNIPYYIHVLISRLCNKDQIMTEELIEQERDLMVQDPNDPAHFAYYEERLKTYYARSDAALALQILDALSRCKDPLGFTEIINLVRYKIDSVEEDALRQVLIVLMKDHYLQRDNQGRFSFRYTLIQQWWLYTRGQN